MIPSKKKSEKNESNKPTADEAIASVPVSEPVESAPNAPVAPPDVPFCTACADQITAHDPGLCGTCLSCRDDRIERLRVANEAEREALDAAVAKALQLEAELEALRTPLAVYGAELRLGNLSLADLIASHRRLRVNLIEDRVARQAAIAQAADEGRSVAEQMALRHGWFSRERLKTMSLGELANLLAETQE